MKKNNLAVLLTCLPLLPAYGPVHAQAPNLSGMWSDPPSTLESMLCFFACFEGSEEILFSLLDDPANDQIPAQQLVRQVMQQSYGKNLAPILTEGYLQDFPLDQSKDPGFTECEPWGFAREIFAPHQLRIEQHSDHIVMQYGEWDITRTIPIKEATTDKDVSHTAMGHSVAHYENGTLVIETSHVSGNIFFFVAMHSDQLTAVERYYKSEDGRLLHLEATFTDPVALTAPVTTNKIWGWAPDQDIAPYDSCKIPDPNLVIEGVL